MIKEALDQAEKKRSRDQNHKSTTPERSPVEAPPGRQNKKHKQKLSPSTVALLGLVIILGAAVGGQLVLLFIFFWP